MYVLNLLEPLTPIPSPTPGRGEPANLPHAKELPAPIPHLWGKGLGDGVQIRLNTSA